MIWLTQMDGEPILLNEDQLVYVEVHHDTLLVLATGDRLRVLESADEVANRVARWRRRVMGLSLVSADEIEEDGQE